MDIKTNYSAQSTANLRADPPENMQVQRLDSATAQRLDETQQTKPSQPQVQQAVNTLQEFTQSIQRNLNFSIDESTGRMVVKVTDSVSGDVIRQLPSEEALRLAESLDEMRSLLFTAQA